MKWWMKEVYLLVNDCIFCKIINGEIPSKKVYEDEEILAFHDINPAAPVHVLVIPKVHIPSMKDVSKDQLNLIGKIHGVIKDIALELNLDKGYRIVNNCGENGGQEVGHLHFHLLGGRKLTWPPG